MSEFQYYEFQALDRPLTEKEMAALRKCSSRARITPSRFVNHYSYGNFKGNIEKWMKQYFDAFVYIADWGTRRLIFRFPNQIIDTEIVKQYCLDDNARCWSTESHLIVEFCVEECPADEWLQEDNYSLTELLPLRSEVSNNDYRLFYLGWLLCLQYSDLSTKTIEPPVPLGLGSLSPALKAFVDFFNLDKKLLVSAATVSSKPLNQIYTDDIEPSIASLSNGEKFQWLCRLALENNPNLQAEFRRSILPDCGLKFFSDKPRRTVAEISNYRKKLRFNET